MREVLQRLKVDIIRRVDSLGNSKDAVSDGDAAAEDGGVFYVVNPVCTFSQYAEYGDSDRSD